MQITLNQAEIEKAIVNFVANQGISITGSTSVTLVAGRAPNGMSATIDISNDPPTAKTVTIIDVTEAKEQAGIPFIASTQDTSAPETEDTVITDKPLFGQ